MSNLKAGPELDEEIARLIGDTVGHKHDREHMHHDFGDPVAHNHYGSVYQCATCGSVILTDDLDEYLGERCVRPYSSDMTAAMIAAEKSGLFGFGAIVSDGWICLSGVVAGDEMKRWRFMQFSYESPACWWLWPDDKGGMIGVAEPTAPLAICAGVKRLYEK